jgi:hypothetical protein
MDFRPMSPGCSSGKIKMAGTSTSTANTPQAI